MKHLGVLALLPLLLLASCATKTQTGPAGGAAAGGAAAGGAATGAVIGQTIGHNTAVTLAGPAMGTLVGLIVGTEMDKYDREQLNHCFERGISGQGSSWVNPDKGYQYTVTPEPAYQEASTHRVCRRAEMKAVINEKPEKTSATACRAEAGNWELQ